MTPLNVLVVDHSAVAREVAARRLSGRQFRVTTAPDPSVASTRVRLAQPDLVLIGLSTPPDDALRFIQQTVATGRASVLAYDRGVGAQGVLTALGLGVTGVLPPALLCPDAREPEATRELARQVMNAARRTGRSLPDSPPEGTGRGPQPDGRTPALIAIGASTGGTNAVLEVLHTLPPDAPPAVIVIHMPADFTGAFARHLDAQCRVAVHEARTGDRLACGRAFVAPGDQHMEVHRRGNDLVLSLNREPPVNGHRPSVDVLLHSVARAAGARAAGTVLTGMGRDGAEGLLALHAAGGTTVVQDESTSVVFGMGREAIRLGAADQVLPLPRIGAALLHLRAPA